MFLIIMEMTIRDNQGQVDETLIKDIKTFYQKVKTSIGDEFCPPAPLAERLCVAIPSKSLIVYISDNYSLVHYDTQAKQIVAEYPFSDTLAAETINNIYLFEDQSTLMIVPTLRRFSVFITDLSLSSAKKADFSQLWREAQDSYRFFVIPRHLLRGNHFYFVEYSGRTRYEMNQVDIYNFSLSTMKYRRVYQITSQVKDRTIPLYLEEKTTNSGKRELFALYLRNNQTHWEYVNISNKKLIWRTRFIDYWGKPLKYFVNERQGFNQANMEILYSSNRFLMFELNRKLIIIDKFQRKMLTSEVKFKDHMLYENHIIGIFEVDSKLDEDIKIKGNIHPNLAFTKLELGKTELSYWVFSTKQDLNCFWLRTSDYQNPLKELCVIIPYNPFLAPSQAQSSLGLYFMALNPFEPIQKSKILTFNKYYSLRFTRTIDFYVDYEFFYSLDENKIEGLAPDRIKLQHLGLQRTTALNHAYYLLIKPTEDEDGEKETVKKEDYPYLSSQDDIISYFLVRYNRTTGQRSCYIEFKANKGSFLLIKEVEEGIKVLIHGLINTPQEEDEHVQNGGIGGGLSISHWILDVSNSELKTDFIEKKGRLVSRQEHNNTNMTEKPEFFGNCFLWSKPRFDFEINRTLNYAVLYDIRKESILKTPKDSSLQSKNIFRTPMSSSTHSSPIHLDSRFTCKILMDMAGDYSISIGIIDKKNLKGYEIRLNKLLTEEELQDRLLVNKVGCIPSFDSIKTPSSLKPPYWKQSSLAASNDNIVDENSTIFYFIFGENSIWKPFDKPPLVKKVRIRVVEDAIDLEVVESTRMDLQTNTPRPTLFLDKGIYNSRNTNKLSGWSGIYHPLTNIQDEIILPKKSRLFDLFKQKLVELDNKISDLPPLPSHLNKKNIPLVLMSLISYTPANQKLFASREFLSIIQRLKNKWVTSKLFYLLDLSLLNLLENTPIDIFEKKRRVIESHHVSTQKFEEMIKHMKRE